MLPPLAQLRVTGKQRSPCAQITQPDCAPFLRQTAKEPAKESRKPTDCPATRETRTGRRLLQLLVAFPRFIRALAYPVSLPLAAVMQKQSNREDRCNHGRKEEKRKRKDTASIKDKEMKSQILATGGKEGYTGNKTELGNN